MRRRDLLTIIGGAAAAGPLSAARLDAADLPPRIGILDPGLPHLFEAFFSGMRNLGYIEGQNVDYIRRSSAGQSEPIPQLAAELADANPAVIVTAGPPAVRAVMNATSTIPLVFAAVGDAIAAGAVTNLAHPDGNATGFSFLNTEISAKRLELLHEAVPGARHIAVLRDRISSGADLKPTLHAAGAIGLEAQLIEVSRPDEYDGAFEAAVATHAEAMDVLGSPIFNANRELLIRLAARHRLPAMYEADEYVHSGGLMSYGPSLADLFRRAAGYVFKLLRGSKPADLPVEQPTKFELAINLKTAKALGLTIPQSLLQRADEVIE
jgi:putative tryptophan/tyrosine transport system substrate-binding protein